MWLHGLLIFAQLWLGLCCALQLRMLVSVESILKSDRGARTINYRLAVVLLEGSEVATAARLAVVGGLANESITKIGAVGSARQDVVMLREALRVKVKLNLADSVLNLIHVFDGRLNRGQVLGDRRGERWLQETGAERIICQGQASRQRERDKVAAAATVAVRI